MAIRYLVLTCDYCEQESEDEFTELYEAHEQGWYTINGPERDLGGNGEKAYCSLACLVVDLS